MVCTGSIIRHRGYLEVGCCNRAKRNQDCETLFRIPPSCTCSGTILSGAGDNNHERIFGFRYGGRISGRHVIDCKSPHITMIVRVGHTCSDTTLSPLFSKTRNINTSHSHPDHIPRNAQYNIHVLIACESMNCPSRQLPGPGHDICLLNLLSKAALL